MIEAAKRGLMSAQLMLAKFDLRSVTTDLYRTPPSDNLAFTERGIALLENAILEGENTGFRLLSDYYEYNVRDNLKAEYFVRELVKQGRNPLDALPLESMYLAGRVSPENRHLHTCVYELKVEDFPRLEELCPRSNGPLTREMVGLPPAPTKTLDLKRYLEDFLILHGTQF